MPQMQSLINRILGTGKCNVEFPSIQSISMTTIKPLMVVSSFAPRLGKSQVSRYLTNIFDQHDCKVAVIMPLSICLEPESYDEVRTDIFNFNKGPHFEISETSQIPQCLSSYDSNQIELFLRNGAACVYVTSDINRALIAAEQTADAIIFDCPGCGMSLTYEKNERREYLCVVSKASCADISDKVLWPGLVNFFLSPHIVDLEYELPTSAEPSLSPEQVKHYFPSKKIHFVTSVLRHHSRRRASTPFFNIENSSPKPRSKIRIPPPQNPIPLSSTKGPLLPPSSTSRLVDSAPPPIPSIAKIIQHDTPEETTNSEQAKEQTTKQNEDKNEEKISEKNEARVEISEKLETESGVKKYFTAEKENKGRAPMPPQRQVSNCMQNCQPISAMGYGFERDASPMAFLSELDDQRYDGEGPDQEVSPSLNVPRCLSPNSQRKEKIQRIMAVTHEVNPEVIIQTMNLQQDVNKPSRKLPAPIELRDIGRSLANLTKNHCNFVAKPTLQEHFEAQVDILRAMSLASDSEINVSNHESANRDAFCRLFLTSHLPPGYRVANGEIIDSSGYHTGKLEIVVVNDDCPAMTINDEIIAPILADSVLCVVDVKSSLTVEALKKTLSRLREVKALMPQHETLETPEGNIIPDPLGGKIITGIFAFRPSPDVNGKIFDALNIYPGVCDFLVFPDSYSVISQSLLQVCFLEKSDAAVNGYVKFTSKGMGLAVLFGVLNAMASMRRFSCSNYVKYLRGVWGQPPEEETKKLKGKSKSGGSKYFM